MTAETASTPAAVPRIDFLGLEISDLDCDPAAAAIAARDPDAGFAYVVTPNAQHMVRLARGLRTSSGPTLVRGWCCPTAMWCAGSLALSWGRPCRMRREPMSPADCSITISGPTTESWSSAVMID